MNKYECPLCFKLYNNQNNIPFLLKCGDTLCLTCIKYHKEEAKTSIECPTCCTNTESSGNTNKLLLDEINKDFEVIINQKNGPIFNIDVKTLYTIKEVKEIIQKKKNMDPKNYYLVGKGALLEDDKTLLDYNITSPTTIYQISFVEGGLF